MRELDAKTVLAIAWHQARVSPLRPVCDVNWRIAGGLASRLAAKTGTVAWYDAKADAVVIPAQYASVCADEMYAPTITHELTHAYQCLRMGFICFQFAKTFRRRLIEAEAVREEKRAQKILNVGVLD